MRLAAGALTHPKCPSRCKAKKVMLQTVNGRVRRAMMVVVVSQCHAALCGSTNLVLVLASLFPPRPGTTK